MNQWLEAGHTVNLSNDIEPDGSGENGGKREGRGGLCRGCQRRFRMENV